MENQSPLPALSPTATVSSPAGKSDAPTGEIRTDSLIKTYGDKNVVNGISIYVKAGEVVGLLGPNGAGKTTTFYMVVGLVPATSGTVSINNQDATQLRMHRRARLGVGYLPQESSIFRKLSVEENILAIVETLTVRSSERPALVKHHLDELSLGHLAKQKAYTLSGGERRRLEIARALVTRPRFLLMDEPFAGVDPISVAEVQKIILDLKQRGIGVLITDHNVRETLRIVDRAYIVNKGKVMTEGTSEFLINDPQARELYLGKDFNL